MHALDALEGGWIFFIFLAAFFWFPAHLFSQSRDSDGLMRIAGNWVRMVLGVVISTFVLSRLGTLNAVTTMLFFLVLFAIAWYLNHAKTIPDWWKSLQKSAIQIVRQIETPSHGLDRLSRSRPGPAPRYQRYLADQWLRLVEGREFLVACLVVVLITTCILAIGHATQELRLDQPAQYDALLHARELTLSLHGDLHPLLFPAIIATTSMLSGRDALEVTRFLSPAVGVLLVLAAGLLVRTCTRSGVAAVAAMYCLGTAAFPAATNSVLVPVTLQQRLWSVVQTSPAKIRATPEFGLGLLFVLLALTFVADWYGNSRGADSLLDFACCLLLAAAVSRSLALILVIGGGVVLLQPVLGLIVSVLACYGLAAYQTLSSTSGPTELLSALPVAAAVGVGCLLGFLQVKLLGRWGQTGEIATLIACTAAAMLWFRPHPLPAQCLEYDVAARVTERIAHQLPRQTWVVAAPVEQLSETLGWGSHEDLASFVEKYQGEVENPAFRFPIAPEDLFVYVEKRPFQIFSHEPQTVSFPVLTDGTYRSYRSPGGRASLESAALRLCESYRQNHPNTDIFFENEDLRIYHIHQVQASDNHQAGG